MQHAPLTVAIDVSGKEAPVVADDQLGRVSRWLGKDGERVVALLDRDTVGDAERLFVELEPDRPTA
ncbi:MAG: hypothetical protein M3R65_00370 [Gemmatimonadota bacterium]|nr:hypothetical protein [Gemmatimonadota bacterium]